MDARHSLMRCRIGTDVYEDTDLPGGRWTNVQQVGMISTTLFLNILMRGDALHKRTVMQLE